MKGNNTGRIRLARPYHDKKTEKVVLSVLRSGKLVQGRLVEEFENRIAEYLDCRHVIAVNSGTAGLHTALAAVRQSVRRLEDTEVITTPLSFSATANAIVHAGCRPIFVDVNEETFNLDVSHIEEKITENTIAIEPVDVYGLPGELEKVNSIAMSHGISVVEDAAEAFGATYYGHKIGTVSTLTCFSTYATKNLQTGEGGFITTNRDDMSEYMRIFRNQGQSYKYNQSIMGYNYRMLEVSAAIGLSQLPQIDKLNAKRRANAQKLRTALGETDLLSFQRVDGQSEHAGYMFAVTLNEKKAGISRDKLVMKLREHGVEADVAWPTPIHLQPYYQATFGFKAGDYPKAEQICRSVFQLPIQPFLTEQEIDRVASTVNRILH